MIWLIILHLEMEDTLRSNMMLFSRYDHLKDRRACNILPAHDDYHNQVCVIFPSVTGMESCHIQ